MWGWDYQTFINYVIVVLLVEVMGKLSENEINILSTDFDLIEIGSSAYFRIIKQLLYLYL